MKGGLIMQNKAGKQRLLTILFILAIMNTAGAGSVFSEENVVNVNYNDTEYSQAGTAYYNKGVEFLKSNNYSAAIAEFRKALRENPIDKSARIQLVNTYLERAQYYNNKAMDYNKAANDLRSAIFYMKYYNNEPVEAKYAADINTMEENLETILYAINADQTPKGHLTMGKSLRAQGEFAAAMTEFQKAVTDTNCRKDALANIGSIYYILNLNTMAIDNLKQAIALDAKNSDLHLKLAGAYERLGKIDLAAEEYNLALSKTSSNDEILMSLENIWRQKVVDNPQDAEAHANLGAVLQKKKDYEGALAQYRKAESINPSNTNTRLNMGTLYQEQKDYETAIEAYDTITNFNPNFMLAYLYKAQCYKALGKKEAAIENYKLALNLDPSNQDIKNELYNMYETTMTPEEKLAYLKQEITEEPKNAGLLYNYAYELHKANRIAEAIPYYNQVIKLAPKNENAYVNLAQAYMQQSSYDKARAVLNDAQGLFPENQTIKKQLASIDAETVSLLYNDASKLYADKKYQEAIEVYNKIVPMTPEALLGIGACYQAMNNNKMAAQSYAKSLQLDPKNVETAYFTALAYANANDYANAKAYAKKALALNPEHKSTKDLLAYVTEQESTALMDKALSMIDKQQYAEALNVLNNVIKSDPKNADAYYYRATVYDAQKKYQLAINDYKKALQYNPKLTITNYSIAIDYDYLAQYTNALSYYKKYLAETKKVGETNDYTRYSTKRIQELKAYDQPAVKPAANKSGTPAASTTK